MSPETFTLTQQPTEITTLVFVAKYPKLTPQTLFNHFTNPQLLLRWWPPVATTDLRLGGSYEMSWPKLNRTLVGEYTRFEPNQHLAFTWSWTHEPGLPTRTVDIVFAPASTGAGAQLTLTQGPYSLEPADQEDRHGHIEGWTHFMDKLNTAFTDPAPEAAPEPITKKPARQKRDKSRVFVLVGTRKGAFIYESNTARKKWKTTGPLFDGWAVHHMSFDPRTNTLFAALNHDVYGPNVHRSTDFGQTWKMSEGPSFPKDSGLSVAKLWRVEPGHNENEVWAGGDPACLFKSTDNGQTWIPVPGLNNHPTREDWGPGAGGLITHCIIPHPVNPNSTYIAISAAGVFKTDNAGETWEPKNKGTHACFMPEGKQWPDYGQCVHHLVMSPTNPNMLFQQNHCGVYRSSDGGESWTSIADGLPGFFGFAMGINQKQEQTIYVAPSYSDETRHSPGAFTVYRSRNGGSAWEKLDNGLPTGGAFLNVLREGIATDSCDEGGVYVGTSTGQVFYSRNEGDSWQALADYLPPVYSVGTVVIGG